MYELLKLVANFGKLRFTEVNGRQFAIAPIKILMPRVLNGSKGALYYPPEEIAKNVEAWNGKPLTVRHPSLNGANVSAHLPEIFAKQEIGRIYNARIDSDNGLMVDGWFDVELTRKLDSRVWNALVRQEKIEVSTGLFTDNERAATNAQIDGTPYEYIARNYRPDHLAILPDEVGACSCQDGCGVFNQAKELPEDCPHCKTKLEIDPDSGVCNRCGKSVINFKASSDFRFPISNKGTPMNGRSWIIAYMVANCACYKNDQKASKQKLEALTDNELKEIILEQRDSIITANAKEDAESGDSKFFEWMMNADGDIRSAFVKMMKRKITAQTGDTGAKNTPPVPPPANPEEEAKKKAEEEAKKKEAEAVAANNNASSRLTKEEQEALNEARRIVDNERKQLVARLTAHITDNAKKQTITANLTAKPIAELRDMVELLPPVANQQTNNSNPVADFFASIGGKATNDQQTINAKVADDVLDIPTHDWNA